MNQQQKKPILITANSREETGTSTWLSVQKGTSRRAKVQRIVVFNTLRPRQNGRHFPDNIFKWIFLNENVWIPIKISLKFVPQGPIDNIPSLVQIMAWRQPGNKPLSEPMMVSLPTHICVTRPQWVKNNLTTRISMMAIYMKLAFHTLAATYEIVCW